jgi:AraC-like DNA-binding protein
MPGKDASNGRWKRPAWGAATGADLLRILNVDDNPAARYIKSRILRRAGHEVLEADSAAAALASIARDQPHVVLLDVKLPDMSGFEVARRIRIDPRTRDLPIVQVSSIAVTPDDEQDGLLSGADAFLSQPVDADTLLDAIETAIRLRRAGAPSGDAAPRLDPASLVRVQALARARMGERLVVKDLADEAGLSEFHFARLFKAATHETPHEFLVRVRIEESKRLLRTTHLALGEIAARVGFRTQAHFSRAFRAATGTAPREYRARLAKSI